MTHSGESCARFWQQPGHALLAWPFLSGLCAIAPTAHAHRCRVQVKQDQVFAYACQNAVHMHSWPMGVQCYVQPWVQVDQLLGPPCTQHSITRQSNLVDSELHFAHVCCLQAVPDHLAHGPVCRHLLGTDRCAGTQAGLPINNTRSRGFVGFVF